MLNKSISTVRYLIMGITLFCNFARMNFNIFETDTSSYGTSTHLNTKKREINVFKNLHSNIIKLNSESYLSNAQQIPIKFLIRTFWIACKRSHEQKLIWNKLKRINQLPFFRFFYFFIFGSVNNYSQHKFSMFDTESKFGHATVIF